MARHEVVSRLFMGYVTFTPAPLGFAIRHLSSQPQTDIPTSPIGSAINDTRQKIRVAHAAAVAQAAGLEVRDDWWAAVVRLTSA